MNTPTENSTIRDPQPTIDVGAIERQLTALWQQASQDEEDGGVTRASMFNLLVYVPSPAEAAKLDDMLTDITAARPCRAILIVADADAPEELITAEVTSRCTLPSASSKQVCCEQVTITAGGAQADEVPSAVAPLLLSDLPVYLWWHAVPRLADKALFRRLVDLSDRVVIDSANFKDQETDLASMAAVLNDTPRWTALSDLNWARLTAWRALLAGFYDISDYRPHLNQLTRVTIRYAPPAGDLAIIPTRALLLAGWLASRLGWTINSKNAKRISGSTSLELSADGRSFELEFEHTRREIEPGHLALVTIETGGEQPISFTVRRSADGKRIETSVTRGEEKGLQRVLSYEGLTETELIGKELEILGHDRVYEQAVLAAGKMVKEMGSQ
ncbi:MAG TPA: glucose-6-phosphate dehydrogenase assembly protein OpcA [Blastocatellia bacterium]|nr:glucose-6-phosphate dehydrogenase assembly protein OpcA [Blastocatellia bacterium]